MNLDRLLSLALSISKQTESEDADEMVRMIYQEMEARIARDKGQKDIYGNILRFIRSIKAYDKSNHKDRSSLYGIFKNDERWSITNGFIGVRFANLDPKDLPVSENGPDFDYVLKEIKKVCTVPVKVVQEPELKLFYKSQVADHKSGGEKPILKVGSHYYDTEQIVFVYSLMNEIVDAREDPKDRSLYLKDAQGNEAVAKGVFMEDEDIQKYREKYGE